MSIPPPVRLPNPGVRYDLRAQEVTHRILTQWFNALWRSDHVVNGKLTNMSGRIRHGVSVSSTPYAALLTDDVIIVNVSGPSVVNMPANPAKWQMWRIIDVSGNASTNPITINGNGKNINGGASVSLSTDYGGLSVIYDGTQFIAN